MDKQKMSDVMIKELQEVLSQNGAPEGALTFAQLHKSMGGKNEQKTRGAIKKLVADGVWETTRSGQGNYYWRVDGV